MALYQLKMYHMRREGHRPKHGEGGEYVGKKSEPPSILKDGGRPRKPRKHMKFQSPEK
jgi:hypothetical protein